MIRETCLIGKERLGRKDEGYRTEDKRSINTRRVNSTSPTNGEESGVMCSLRKNNDISTLEPNGSVNAQNQTFHPRCTDQDTRTPGRPIKGVSSKNLPPRVYGTKQTYSAGNHVFWESESVFEKCDSGRRCQTLSSHRGRNHSRCDVRN